MVAGKSARERKRDEGKQGKAEGGGLKEKAGSVRQSRGREERSSQGWREVGERRGGGTADHCSKGIPRLERGVAPQLRPPLLPPSISVLLALNPDVLVFDLLSVLICTVL